MSRISVSDFESSTKQFRAERQRARRAEYVARKSRALHQSAPFSPRPAWL
jgi:hypothetical protein